MFIMYYSSDSPSSLVTESLSVTQSLLHTRRVSRVTVKALVTSNIIQPVCLAGKRRLKERCGLEPRTNIFFRLRNRQKLVRFRFEKIRYIREKYNTLKKTVPGKTKALENEMACDIYRVIQKERSVSWEVLVWVIM